MKYFCIPIILSVIAIASANINGPYIFWGHEKVINLQPRALVEASEQDFTQLFRDVKSIVIFVRNSTKRLDGLQYPKFQELIKQNAWTYLPQRSLAADPFNLNANIEVINLSGASEESDSEIVSGYSDALSIYGNGEVLGILASREEDAHYIAKREAKKGEEEEAPAETGTTAQTLTDETDESFIFVADGQKAILYVNSAPELNITSLEFTNLKLTKHNKLITFDDQSKTKGYGRLTIIFMVNEKKLYLRFSFTLLRGTWLIKGVEIEYEDYKNFLDVVGNEYTVPSAPIGFSYRCSSYDLIFGNSSDTLRIVDYQIQPWLNGALRFGDVYDCIGFTTAPIWAGVLITLFLGGILTVGFLALMDIKTPNRFESSRSKQLTFTVQE